MYTFRVHAAGMRWIHSGFLQGGKQNEHNRFNTQNHKAYLVQFPMVKFSFLILVGCKLKIANTLNLVLRQFLVYFLHLRVLSLSKLTLSLTYEAEARRVHLILTAVTAFFLRIFYYICYDLVNVYALIIFDGFIHHWFLSFFHYIWI